LSSRIFKKYERGLDVLNKDRLEAMLKNLRLKPDVDLFIKLLAIRDYYLKTSFKTSEIADILGVSETSVTRWVKSWNRKGLDGLKNKTILLMWEKELDLICKKRCKEKKKDDDN
jgi:DNA-binding MarR family transcriptional regulator